MILSSAQMRAYEEAAFAGESTPESLMEEAGAFAAKALRELYGGPGTCLAVFGKGNNGGDALVVARHLASAGWKVSLAPAFAEVDWGELVARKSAEAGRVKAYPSGVKGLQQALEELGNPQTPVLILDGLLGIGSHGTLREPVASFVQAINAHRACHLAHDVIALDLPTGLDADSGAPGEPCLVADVTLTIGATKRGLVADRATPFVGRLVEVRLPGLDRVPVPRSSEEESLDEVITPANLAGKLRRRSFDIHKGECGRVAIVAGSLGLTGAARLCSEACVRAGAGLVTLYVPEEAYPIVAASTAPEVMVRGVATYHDVSKARHDVLAVGPGLGQTRAEEVLALIRKTEVPTVIDADALNIVAPHLEVLRNTDAPKLLTPHPGEFARLAPESKELTRRQAALAFVEKHPVTLLLKGSRTVIARRGAPLSYNTTGHPGMATGGMGDVLTGVCAGLAGQGYDLHTAARIGAWVCGRAAELAVQRGRESAESLTPLSVMHYLGQAFSTLHARGY